MPGNREKAQALCLKLIEELIPKSGNKEIYQRLFEKMSDEEFDEFMGKLDREEIRLAVTVSAFSQAKLDVKRNLDLAKKLGHNFFERVWMQSQDGKSKYLSPIPYLVVELPVRRQAQILIKKISIPEDNKSVDNLTGQPTGSSKGAKISYPELQILAALGLDKTAVELIKFRGGDQQGLNAMNNSIRKTGGVSQSAIEALGTKVKSTTTLSTLLKSAHLDNTL